MFFICQLLPWARVCVCVCVGQWNSCVCICMCFKHWYFHTQSRTKQACVVWRHAGNRQRRESCTCEGEDRCLVWIIKIANLFRIIKKIWHWFSFFSCFDTWSLCLDYKGLLHLTGGPSHAPKNISHIFYCTHRMIGQSKRHDENVRKDTPIKHRHFLFSLTIDELRTALLAYNDYNGLVGFSVHTIFS